MRNEEVSVSPGSQASLSDQFPAPSGPLFGRSVELAAACATLQDGDTRLLTLCGPGGSGKTRLALQVAWELRDRFADGVLFVPLAPLHAAQKPQIQVEELTLGNGMRFLLYESHESPVISAGWVARVGSANERPGITGLSHFFEHMMFKGTRVIGTKDAAADLRLIEQQERLRDEMRAEESLLRARLRRGEIDDLQKPENWSERYREQNQRFQALVGEQRKTIVKDEMDQIYTRNGGEALNAFTNQDLTAYFVRVPQNRLELWAWLESDRLLHPVFREFYSERDVVFEERRLRTESTPLGKFDEEFDAVFWDAHPYTWPVVGWPSDIPSYTKAQADAYFATYYAPNNLTGVLVGDFRAADVRPLLGRYFGRIPRGKQPVPEVVTLARSLPASELVLDGEAIALADDGRPRPFQETASRTATALVDGQTAVAVTAYFFDLLHLDGRDLLDAPGAERHAALTELVPPEALVPRVVTDDLETAQRFTEAALAAGHEGVVVKSLTAPYAAVASEP